MRKFRGGQIREREGSLSQRVSRSRRRSILMEEVPHASAPCAKARAAGDALQAPVVATTLITTDVGIAGVNGLADEAMENRKGDYEPVGRHSASAAADRIPPAVRTYTASSTFG